MYLEFYRLREQPFGVTPNPQYLYFSQTHREALASLSYGVESGCGFMALIARPGMGKTTLLFRLLDYLKNSAGTVFLFQTQCNSHQLLRLILGDLGLDAQEQDPVRMHMQLNEVLLQEARAGRRVVLAIDEAQNLKEEVLETVRLLSDFETPRSKLLQIILAGQPELAAKLARPSLSQLRQRISILCRLNPFPLNETARYIEHRLKVAGYQGRPLFTPAAIEVIAQESQGIPRVINTVCFNALSLGCALGRHRIEPEIVREVLADLTVHTLAESPREDPKHAATAVPATTYASPLPAPQNAAAGRGAAKNEFGVARIENTPAATQKAARLALISGGSASQSERESVSANWLVGVGAAAAVLALFILYFGSSLLMPGGMKANAASSAADHQSADPRDARLDPRSVPSVYVVKPNETLERISVRYFGRYDVELLKQFQALNPQLSNPDRIEVGQRLHLPQPSDSSQSGVLGKND